MPESPAPTGNETPPASAQPTDRRAAWAMGWIMIGVGLAIGCVTIGWPLYLAHTHAPEITISMKRSVVPILLIVFGIADVLGIKTFGKMFEDGHHITFFDIVRLLILAAIGIGAEYLLKRHIESLGYYFPL